MLTNIPHISQIQVMFNWMVYTFIYVSISLRIRINIVDMVFCRKRFACLQNYHSLVHSTIYNPSDADDIRTWKEYCDSVQNGMITRPARYITIHFSKLQQIPISFPLV